MIACDRVPLKHSSKFPELCKLGRWGVWRFGGLGDLGNFSLKRSCGSLSIISLNLLCVRDRCGDKEHHFHTHRPGKHHVEGSSIPFGNE
jgi:hypothetical protein